MSFPISSIFLLAANLALSAASHAHVVLKQQCWNEYPYPLSTVHISSSLDGSQEQVSPISDSKSTQSLFKRKETETDYAPWSYAPTCSEILPSINDRLCVYTNTSFAHGRGISIFTTAALAQTFSSLPAFTDSHALTTLNINANTTAWRAAPIPGKGIGMLAARDLVFKDAVTAYTPVFLAYLEMDLSTLGREAWWRLAIEQLPEAMKEAFLELTYVFGDERVRVQDIVKANSFQVDVGGVNHLAIFPETSRFNHDCAPNAQYVIDTELLTHTVRVTRPIAQGEEITVSYTAPLEPLATRQQHLQQGFHFPCTCPRCLSPTSDATLSRIHALQSALNDWSASSTGSPAAAEELLQLHRDEGLEGFMDVAYGFAALAYNAVGEEKQAVRYAALAKEAILMKDGTWSANLKLWEGVIGDARGHWSWGRRL